MATGKTNVALPCHYKRMAEGPGQKKKNVSNGRQAQALCQKRKWQSSAEILQFFII